MQRRSTRVARSAMAKDKHSRQVESFQEGWFYDVGTKRRPTVVESQDDVRKWVAAMIPKYTKPRRGTKVGNPRWESLGRRVQVSVIAIRQWMRGEAQTMTLENALDIITQLGGEVQIHPRAEPLPPNVRRPNAPKSTRPPGRSDQGSGQGGEEKR